MLLEYCLRLVQKRHARNLVKELDLICAWTNGIALILFLCHLFWKSKCGVHITNKNSDPDPLRMRELGDTSVPHGSCSIGKYSSFKAYIR